MKISSELTTTFALLAAMLLWASSFVALKYTFEHFDPWFVIFARMAVALLFALMIAPGIFRSVSITRQDLRSLLLMALFEPGLYFVFETEALKNTAASQAGMITALFPVMVALGAWLWIGERIGFRIVFGGLLAFAGAVGLSLTAASDTSAPAPLYGNFMEFLAMVSAVAYTLTLKRLSHRFGPLFLTAFQALAGTAFFALFLLFRPEALPRSFPPEPTLAILYLGVAVSFVAYGLYNYGVSRIPASRASLFINLIPVFAVLLGWGLLDERFSWREILASALILTGVFIAQRDVPPDIKETLGDPELPKGA